MFRLGGGCEPSGGFLPRVQEGYASCNEVGGIARDDRQAMDKGGGGDRRVALGSGIGHMKRGATARDRQIEVQNATRKSRQHDLVHLAAERFRLCRITSL